MIPNMVNGELMFSLDYKISAYPLDTQMVGEDFAMMTAPRENDPFQIATRMIAETLWSEITNMMVKRNTLRMSVLESKTGQPVQSAYHLLNVA